MEHINMDTEPAVAPGDARWSAYRPRRFFADLTSSPLVPGTRRWIDFSGSGSTFDVNDFTTIDNNSDLGAPGVAVPGVILTKLGVYWLHGAIFIAEFDSGGVTTYEEVLVLGPSLEDVAVMSSQADTLSQSTTVDNFHFFDGFAVVTDLNADNHVYISVLARGSWVNSHVPVLTLGITYMGLADVSMKNG